MNQITKDIQAEVEKLPVEDKVAFHLAYGAIAGVVRLAGSGGMFAVALIGAELQGEDEPLITA